jgi:hypothetical protein
MRGRRGPARQRSENYSPAPSEVMGGGRDRSHSHRQRRRQATPASAGRHTPTHNNLAPTTNAPTITEREASTNPRRGPPTSQQNPSVQPTPDHRPRSVDEPPKRATDFTTEPVRPTHPRPPAAKRRRTPEGGDHRPRSVDEPPKGAITGREASTNPRRGRSPAAKRRRTPEGG